MTDLIERLSPAMLNALRPSVGGEIRSGRVFLREDVDFETGKSLVKLGYAYMPLDRKWRLTPKGERASAWLNLIERDVGAAIGKLAELNEEGGVTK